MSFYSQVKEYGIKFFYENNDEIPHQMFSALELIRGEVARNEELTYQTGKKNAESNKT